MKENEECKKCGNNVFAYNDYWEEYTCTECAYVHNGVSPKEAVVTNEESNKSSNRISETGAKNQYVELDKKFEQKCDRFISALFHNSKSELLSIRNALNDVFPNSFDISNSTRNKSITFFMLMGVSVAHLQSSGTLVLTSNERNVIKYEAIESYFKLVRNNNIGHAQVFGLEYFEFYLNLAKEGLNKEKIVFPYPFQKVVKNYLYDITHDHDHPAFMQDELAIKIEMDHYSINFFQILNDLMLLTTSNLLKLWNEA